MEIKPVVPEHKYRDELIATARAIVAPGKGILAADESTNTIGKRFDKIGVKNTQDNRRDYRHLLFTTPELSKNISGVILFEETLNEMTADGKTPFIEVLKSNGFIMGIKVDKGTRPLPFARFANETYTEGLDDLDKRCAAFYQKGVRFAKWRAVLAINENHISEQAIQENAYNLARYAAICQANGLVPIVEPEILMDGTHSLATCQYWTERVVSTCYYHLNRQNVLLEGTLLKPNMVLPGQSSGQNVTVEDVARATVTALQRSVPAAVPGITFLSGGQSETEATAHLNALNALALGSRPWALTFSYGRALQQTCLELWKGLQANVSSAQQGLHRRAQLNGLAAQGKYDATAEAAPAKSLYEKNYTY